MQTEKSVRGTICGLLVGILVVVSAVLVVPKIIDAMSSYAYKKQKRDVTKLDDDWGPEIVKKNKETEEDSDGI